MLAEHRRAFDVEFPKFHDGLFFFYFSSLDLNAHMMWRLTDPQHPATTPRWPRNTDRRWRNFMNRSIRCWAR